MSKNIFLISLGATSIIVGSLVAVLAAHPPRPKHRYYPASSPTLSVTPVAAGQSPRHAVNIEIERMCRNLAACEPDLAEMDTRTCASLVTSKVSSQIDQLDRLDMLPQFARALSTANDRCANSCDDLESCFMHAAADAIVAEN